MAGTPVYGTYLEGENIYQSTLTPAGLIVMGNEGKGISPELAPLITRRLNIPSFAVGPASESLNVGVATAIIASEFKRRINILP
jgi:TrmH family RNA methyltransferase